MKTMLEVFGIHCFSEKELKSRVPKDVFKSFKKVQSGKEELSITTANVIANAIKLWAIENGATHFTHWFQPLTELTAEKHESFLSVHSDGTSITEFTGKELIKGESDTSSFPNGGLRSTFEARGYTAWDIGSPMFLKGEGLSKSLYIPTAFIGYSGEALDKKVPLLRSISAVRKEALRIQKTLGDFDTRHIDVTLGVEQEYFLVEKKFFDLRKDLTLSGRTVFGNLPPKGQEMNDHYYGTIKERVEAFMTELDTELWKVGVMSKTKHNEVAPNQFEVAIMFNTANVAVDQNQITMDMIKKVATRHHLTALLHEKPFHGINGSGKHCNWSLSTDTGKNLLDPSSLEENRFDFLLYVMAVMEGVYRYSGILRACTATPGNDYRLGGHEAPPAIISIFLGNELQQIFENIQHNNLSMTTQKDLLDLGSSFPKIPKDISDRNRTSPFAFTGNKFEFRMPGSSASPATPTFILNTIVADILKEYADKLEQWENISPNVKVVKLIQEQYPKYKNILFNGNGYDKNWEVEAKALGLQNFKNTVEALPNYISEESIALFERNQVLTRAELQSRFHVYCERYNKQNNIEISSAIEISRNEIYPSVLAYITKIAQNIDILKSLVEETEYQEEKKLLKTLLTNKNEMLQSIHELVDGMKTATSIVDQYQRAQYYSNTLIPKLTNLRKVVDILEKESDKHTWPIPSYYDLLFNL